VAAVPFLILGNPENRRVTHFQDALAKEGLPPAHVVAWSDFLAAPEVLDALPDTPTLVRIESPGESDAVERAFLRRGYPAARDYGCRTISPQALEELAPSHGRIVCPRQAHLGFEHALEELDAVLARHPSWRVLTPTDEIRELFDKRRTSARFSAAGIPVPEALPTVSTREALRAGLDAHGWPQAFVKLTSGSSASCLGVLHRRGDRETLHTTIERAADGYFNTLRVRHVLDPRAIGELLDFLLAEGSHVERAVPKARLDRAFFDCRVLCIAGEPRFVVVRQNRHPITNLHLGGWRGELDRLRAEVPADAWDAAMDSCRRVAACYRSIQLGIDLMFEPDFQGHRVIEANAFGDLLPRLEVDGADVWQWQIRAALALPSP
jgi:hypothetical protein